MKTKITYSTNELENAIDYIEKAAFFFNESNDKHRFKWLMISLHGALYSFGICNIKGTNPIGRIFKTIKKKELDRIIERVKRNYTDFIYGDQSDESFLRYGTFMSGKILDINSVLSRCESEAYMMQFTHSKTLKIGTEQRLAIDKLISYRNDFAHFKPMAYGITGNYENDIVLPVLKVIEFLALETNNILYPQVESCERVKHAIKHISLNE